MGYLRPISTAARASSLGNVEERGSDSRNRRWRERWAGALQSQGVDVVVLERQPEVRDTGAGISLWPNALAALDVAGFGVAARSLGRTLAAGGIQRLDGRAALSYSRRNFEAALGDGLICVDRGELVRALAGRLRPGTVRTGCAVTGYGLGSSAVPDGKLPAPLAPRSRRPAVKPGQLLRYPAKRPVLGRPRKSAAIRPRVFRHCSPLLRLPLLPFLMWPALPAVTTRACQAGVVTAWRRSFPL
jgi:hypothetical protein